MKNFYLTQILLMLVIFLLTGKSLYDAFGFQLIPGDSYTYEASLYYVMDRASDHYWATLYDMATGGSPHNASLMPILVALFSPLLIKEPSSLVFVNFIAILGAILLLRKLLVQMIVNDRVATIVSMLLWFMPFNYTQRIDTTSLLSLMPDTLFLWMMCIASILTIKYLSFPENWKYALASAVSVGLAIWARGNSFSYVGLLGALVVISISIRCIRIPSRLVINNFIAWLVTTALIVAFFFYYHHARIADYYGLIYSLNIGSYTLEKSINGGIWIINNIPGVFFTHGRDNIVTYLVSYGFHIYFVWLLWYAFFHQRITGSQVLIRTSLLFSSLYYLLGLVFGCLSFGAIYSLASFRVLGPFAPILVGIVISIAVLLAISLNEKKWVAKRNGGYLILGGAIIIVVYANVLTNKYMQTEERASDPSAGLYTGDYQAFSLNFSEITKGKPVAFLWYRDLTSVGIFYYQQKLSRFDPRKKTATVNLVNLHNLFYTSLDPKLVSTSDEFRSTVKKVLSDADFILIPEILDDYKDRQRNPGLFSTYYQVLAEVLNDAEGPNYIVKAIVNESGGHRIFLLEKVSDPMASDEQFFEKNWGTTDQRLQRNYPGASMFGYVPEEHEIDYSYSLLKDESFSSFVEFTVKKKTIKLYSYKPIKVDVYQISSGLHVPESLDRGPFRWELYGALNGGEWKLIDERKLTQRWKDSETRSFKINSPGEYNRYKFKFIEAEVANSCCRIYEIHFFENGIKKDEKFSSKMELIE